MMESERIPLLGEVIRGAPLSPTTSRRLFPQFPVEKPPEAVGSNEARQKMRETRTFRMRLEHIKLGPGCTAVRPFIRFRIGKTAATKSPKFFHTNSLKKFSKGSREFSSCFETFYQCCYEQLSSSFLYLELMEDQTKMCFGGSVSAGSARVSLASLASGNPGRRVSFYRSDDRNDMDGMNDLMREYTGSVSFVCYFEEEMQYALHFNEWSANIAFAPSQSMARLMPTQNFPLRHLHIKLDEQSTFSSISTNPLYPQFFREDDGVLIVKGCLSDVQQKVIEAVLSAGGEDRRPRVVLGRAVIPLRSIGISSFLKGSLLSVTKDGDTKSFLGTLFGYVQLEDCSAYKQSSSISPSLYNQNQRQFVDFDFKGLKDHTRLWIKLEAVENLIEENDGHGDFFVQVEWDHAVVRSAVEKTGMQVQMDNVFVFPFPTRAMVGQAPLWQRAAVSFYVYRCLRDSPECNIFVGGYDLDLEKVIDRSPLKDCIHMHDPVTGRITDIAVSIACWFDPNLPAQFRQTFTQQKSDNSDAIVNALRAFSGLQHPESGEKHAQLLEIEEFWRQGIPDRLLRVCNYDVQVQDEKGKYRFLPTYLARVEPMNEIATPAAIEKTVRRIEWESVERANWESPNHFLTRNVGGKQAHTLLLANLLLGLGIDCYVCVGGDDVWVATRHSDGRITYWDVRNGKQYNFEHRWMFEGTPNLLHEVSSLLGQKGSRKNAVKPEEMVFYDEDPLLKPSIPFFSKNWDWMDPRKRKVSKKQRTLPWSKLEMVFNHRNLWANLQLLDPQCTMFDLDDPDQWHPVFPAMDHHSRPESHWGMSFYSPKRLSAPFCPTMTAGLVYRIETAIIHSFTQWRKDHDMYTAFDEQITDRLVEGLRLLHAMADDGASYVRDPSQPSIALSLSKARLQSSVGTRDMGEWRDDLVNSLPRSHAVETKVISLSFFDPIRVCSSVMNECSFHRNEDPDVRFGLGVVLVPYHNKSSLLLLHLARIFPDTYSYGMKLIN